MTIIYPEKPKKKKKLLELWDKQGRQPAKNNQYKLFPHQEKQFYNIVRKKDTIHNNDKNNKVYRNFPNQKRNTPMETILIKRKIWTQGRHPIFLNGMTIQQKHRLYSK